MLYKKYGKRLLDLLIVLTLVVFFSWVVVVVLLCYFIFWEFPILFRQRRIGKDNLPFVMLKFRTLSANESIDMNKRNFLFGKLLRLTSLDELPQIWNVIRGQMSFIGPRPLPENYLQLYSAEQRRRHEVKPGITGWAQVNGRNAISWARKFELDIDYVDNLSFLMDAKILAKTVLLILSFKKDVSLLEKKFEGN